MSDFVLDLQSIRDLARCHMELGAVTSDYQGDRQVILKLLNDALATELVCVLRYKRHYYMAEGIHSEAVRGEFAEHAKEEQEHADQLASRIAQLDGEPNFNPVGLADRSHSQYVEGFGLLEMLREDLVAERIAIATYSEMVRYIGEKDATTRRLLERILEKEEEHAEDLKSLLVSFDHGAGEEVGQSIAS